MNLEHVQLVNIPYLLFVGVRFPSVVHQLAYCGAGGVSVQYFSR